MITRRSLLLGMFSDIRSPSQNCPVCGKFVMDPEFVLNKLKIFVCPRCGGLWSPGRVK